MFIDSTRCTSQASTSGRQSNWYFSTAQLPVSNPASRKSEQKRGRSKRKLLSEAVVSSNAEAIVTSLGLTAENNNSVAYDPEKGLTATRSFRRGETVLSVPERQWLSGKVVANSDIGTTVKKLQPWLQLTLFLMQEEAQARTPWRAYLNSLTKSVDSPVCWSEAELKDLLEGTQLLEMTLNFREYLQSTFSTLEDQIFLQNKDLFPSSAFNFDTFLWASTVLRSRVHPPLEGDSLALVPLADLVAHQRGPGVSWNLPGNFLRGEKSLIVKADRDFGAGEVLTMDFGPNKLDSELLLYHGAMDDFVNRGGLVLNLELPKDDKFFDDKADILEINGLSTAEEFPLTSASEPTETLLAFLRLMNLSGQDAFLLESLFRNEAWGHLSKPLSFENESAVFRSMIECCRDTLEICGTASDGDKAKLREVQPGSRQEKALRIRMGEREALKATLEFFEERVGKLENNVEYYQERRLRNLGLLDDDGRSTYDDFFKDGIA